MSHSDISEELRAIEAALQARPGPTITGGQLFSLITSVAPSLDVRALVDIPRGPGALTEFVRRYMTGLVERIGNHGGDVLYRIDGRDLSDLQPLTSGDIWRAFVSPSSPKHLVLNRSARRLMARDTPASAAADEIELARASTVEHDRIRADFTASLSEREAAVLRSHVDQNANFVSWIGALREYLPEVTGKWGQYRRQRLSALFAARVQELGLEDSLERAVLDQLRAAELSAYERPKAGRTEFVESGSRHTNGQSDTAGATVRARRLAHVVIDLLAYDELRALKMPLGVMLDAIRAEQ